jgi:hypothetical protein
MLTGRSCSDLQRRGCFRTALEFAKLLYALDPAGDPHGALLYLDFLAPKSGAGSWLLSVWEEIEALSGNMDGKGREKEGGNVWKGRMDPRVLPGWAFARALALRAHEDAENKVSLWNSLPLYMC